MPSKEAQKRWREKNKEHLRAYGREYSKKYHAANRDKARERQLRSKYGIGSEQYDEMLQAQEGRCAICRQFPNQTQVLCVDHCHTSGKVRALLCQKCNSAIGLLDDDPQRAHAAAYYLEKHV